MTRLCVFCGSREGGDPTWIAAARELGSLLPGRGLGLVYGGGSRGMMGAVADAALEAGGEVIGVIPEGLFEREHVHTGVTEVRAVATLLERKALMAELSDAFVALPGGLGTLDELFEMWTWTQLGIHAKALGILDTGGYYAGLLACLDGMVDAGYVDAAARRLPVVEERPDRLLDAVFRFQLPPRARVIPPHT